MKVLIAIVMFLFGIFVGLLIVPTFQEFANPMSFEEEYSMQGIKSILHEFDITLPLEAFDVNLFRKQDGQTKQLWVKFECSPDVRDDFLSQLNAKHSGMFNREIESPKKIDGSMIPWWSYRNTFRYYEFHGMCAAYDELLRTMYIYAVSEDNEQQETPFPQDGESEDWN